VQRVLGDFVDLPTLKRLAGEDELNMTRLALSTSEYVNGVAKRHAETSRRLFPGYRVGAVTNGVHPFTWTHPAFARLYDRHLPGWCHEPELLVRADCSIPAEALWQARAQAKQELIGKVNALTGVRLGPHRMYPGFRAAHDRLQAPGSAV
jgi:glycogen phosphorylase